MVRYGPVSRIWCAAALLLVSACSDPAFGTVLRNPCSEPIVFEVRLFDSESTGPPSLHPVDPAERFEDFYAVRPDGAGLIVSVPSLGYEEVWVDPPAKSYRVFRPDVSLCPEVADD